MKETKLVAASEEERNKQLSVLTYLKKNLFEDYKQILTGVQKLQSEFFLLCSICLVTPIVFFL